MSTFVPFSSIHLCKWLILRSYAIRIQITNPPFYASEAEMLESAKQKSRPPNSACTGAPIEMIVNGGEVAFVSQLIKESATPQNRRKIQWFSSMLGKLSSVSQIIEQLQEAKCSNYAVTEFIQGQKTRRWCIAWSWLSLRPPTAIARGIPALDKKMLPFPSDFDFHVTDMSKQQIEHAINSEISRLDLKWLPLSVQSGGVGRSVNGDVWSRKARRKKQQHDEEMKDVDNDESSSGSDEEAMSEPALAFRISVQPEPNEPRTSHRVSCRWLQGQEAVLFESFCGWLKRKTQA